ncbi:hypothetical protein HGB07_02300 [Candidatus Roizmanbacteria bacterium]|nr:hypothetical protein [Candidatus Roizmanbacteria bacterium]
MKTDPRFAKQKKKMIQKPTKAIVRSTYLLNDSEIGELRQLFPIMGDLPVENSIDNTLYAGVVVLVGTKRIDLSLSRGLQNLKNFIYEGR